MSQPVSISRPGHVVRPRTLFAAVLTTAAVAGGGTWLVADEPTSTPVPEPAIAAPQASSPTVISERAAGAQGTGAGPRTNVVVERVTDHGSASGGTGFVLRRHPLPR